MNCVCSQCRNWQPPDGAAAPRDEFAEAAGVAGMYVLLWFGAVGLAVFALVSGWDQYGWNGPWLIMAFLAALMVLVPLGILVWKVTNPPPFLMYVVAVGALVTGFALPCIFAQ